MSYRDRDGEWEVGQRPLSAFEHLAGVQAPKYESSSYQAAARNRKPDPVEPRRMTAKEMEAEYWLHVKSTALAIANAGRRRRGEPLLRCLPQDEPLLPRYERDDPDDASESPDEGDDTPVDDRKDKGKTKGKKRAKPAKADDEPEAEDEPKDEGDGDSDTNPDERKNKAIALQIVNAGRRRRNMPLLRKLEQDR